MLSLFVSLLDLLCWIKNAKDILFFFNPFKSSEGKMDYVKRRKECSGMQSLNCLLRNKGSYNKCQHHVCQFSKGKPCETTWDSHWHTQLHTQLIFHCALASASLRVGFNFICRCKTVLSREMIQVLCLLISTIP